jgi:hypothetical protein
MPDDETGTDPATSGPGGAAAGMDFEPSVDGLALEATADVIDGPSLVAGPHACPWCSADLGGPGVDRCPACGAHLTGDPDASIPGVTSLDPEIVRRAASPASAPKRRFIGFLGDPQPDAINALRASSVEALAPPSAEVRLEMRRLRAELDAVAAAAQATTDEAAALVAGLGHADLQHADLQHAAAGVPEPPAAEREQPAP